MSMVATKDPWLAAVVLIAAAYDLGKVYLFRFWRMNANLEKEAGTSEAAFKARSALHHADKIKAAVLLLHGGKDDRHDPEQAELLARKLTANSVPMRLMMMSIHSYLQTCTCTYILFYLFVSSPYRLYT